MTSVPASGTLGVGGQSMEEQYQRLKAALLDLLSESYDTFTWHGPNLMQALAGLDAHRASWRPASDQSAWTIRQIVLHVARVMQECSASLPGADRSLLTTLRPDERPGADLRDHEEWRRDIEDLQRSYDTLRQSLSALDPAILAMRSPSTAYGREWTFLQHVYGVALHNVYHAAQIVTLRRRQGTWTELS